MHQQLTRNSEAEGRHQSYKSVLRQDIEQRTAGPRGAHLPSLRGAKNCSKTATATKKSREFPSFSHVPPGNLPTCEHPSPQPVRDPLLALLALLLLLLGDGRAALLRVPRRGARHGLRGALAELPGTRGGR